MEETRVLNDAKWKSSRQNSSGCLVGYKYVEQQEIKGEWIPPYWNK